MLTARHRLIGLLVVHTHYNVLIRPFPCSRFGEVRTCDIDGLYQCWFGADNLYNRQMALRRILLAVAFLLATLLGNSVVITAPMAMPMGADQMMNDMGPKASVKDDCIPCKQRSNSTALCMTSCGMSAVPLSVMTQLHYDKQARAFHLALEQSMEGADYPPDPHPPKPPIFI